MVWSMNYIYLEKNRKIGGKIVNTSFFNFFMLFNSKSDQCGIEDSAMVHILGLIFYSPDTENSSSPTQINSHF